MSSRPLAVLASLILAVLGVVVLLPDCASACSCLLAEGSREEIVEGALSDSEAVFSGEVVALERGKSNTPIPGYDTLTLRTSEVWKGPRLGTLEVDVFKPCGINFKEGREYLVYAYGKRDLKTDSCTETKPLEKAEADLAALGAGKKPTGGEVLTDTSGGVSARSLVGLALAASLLAMVRLVRVGQTKGR